jgi:hypothetical protein
MKKFLMGLLAAMVLVIVAATIAAGYFGFVPGLSSAFGSDKPRDIGGETYGQAELDTAHSLGAAVAAPLPPGQTPQQMMQAGGTNTLKGTTFTPRVTSAMLNEHFPIKQATIKFNSDKTVEMSGLIQKSRIDRFAVLTAMPPEHVNFIKRFMIFTETIPFYWKFRGFVRNYKVSLDVDQAEVGRLPVTGQMKDQKSFLQTYLEERSASIPGHKIENLTFEDGVMKVDGTVPKVFPLEGLDLGQGTGTTTTATPTTAATPTAQPSVASSPTR